MSGKNAWKPFKPTRLQDVLPEKWNKRLREIFVFTDATGATEPNQMPPAREYRYPSPDDQPEAHVPSEDSKDIVYNTQYYTRDIRRMHFPLRVENHPTIETKQRPQLPADAKMGSPGRDNPAVYRYDPTGTRSAMTATHEARDRLILQHMSSQVVRMEWEGEEEKILKECEEKGIPPVPGRPMAFEYPEKAFKKAW